MANKNVFVQREDLNTVRILLAVRISLKLISSVTLDTLFIVLIPVNEGFDVVCHDVD